jgi:hypothetical protein
MCYEKSLCAFVIYFKLLCVTAIPQNTQSTSQNTQRNMREINENELKKILIACAFEVHKQLGLGLLESAYQECLYYELSIKFLAPQKMN